MSSLDFDVDSHMNALEREWRDAFESGIEASACYQNLKQENARPADIARAREQLERTELTKARIMAKIERLEARLNQ